MEQEKKSGRIVFKELEFEDYLKKRVGYNNQSSGKINLPKELIGKEVYVVIPKKKNE